MIEWIIGIVALVSGVGVLGYGLQRRRSTAQRAVRQRLDGALEEGFPQSRSHLERPPRVRTVRSNTGDNHDVNAAVPVIRVDLGTAESPGLTLVFEYVVDILQVVHPEGTDIPVDHYDIEFTYGPGGLLVSGPCQRVSVPAELASQTQLDARNAPTLLRRALEAHRKEHSDERAAVWEPCQPELIEGVDQPNNPCT